MCTCNYKYCHLNNGDTWKTIDKQIMLTNLYGKIEQCIM